MSFSRVSFYKGTPRGEKIENFSQHVFFQTCSLVLLSKFLNVLIAKGILFPFAENFLMNRCHFIDLAF